MSCLTLCGPMDCSLLGPSVHGIFQARILEWVAISFSRGSSQPRDRTRVSRIAGRHFRQDKCVFLRTNFHSKECLIITASDFFLFSHWVMLSFLKYYYVNSRIFFHIFSAFQSVTLFFFFFDAQVIQILLVEVSSNVLWCPFDMIHQSSITLIFGSV